MVLVEHPHRNTGETKEQFRARWKADLAAIYECLTSPHLPWTTPEYHTGRRIDVVGNATYAGELRTAFAKAGWDVYAVQLGGRYGHTPVYWLEFYPWGHKKPRLS